MRRGMSRFLLVVLGALAVAVLVRTLRGPSEPDTLVAFGTTWDPGDVRERAFQLDRPLRLAVTAIGSFEAPVAGIPEALAAYGWVLNATTRDTVWVMRASAAAKSRATLATVKDTVAFAPGAYEAYFAAVGDPLRPVQDVDGGFLDRARALLQGNRNAWHTDAEQWRFRLDPVVPDSVRFARSVARPEQPPQPPDLVWATGPLENRADSTAYLDVPTATRLWVDATGEIFDEAIDYGWIEDLVTDERVWTMTRTNTVWAGGSAKNRRVRDTLRLEPGRYRVGFTTDGSHAHRDWTANPPFDPRSWGLTLGGGGGTARLFEPYTDLPEVVALRKVGDDQVHTASFTLTAPTRAFIWALGELRSSRSYDFARLLRVPDQDGISPRPPEEIWEMEYETTRHGGGRSDNRVAEVVLDLAPGRYTLRYQTDGSHSPDGWHGGAPTHAERWGAAVFALNRDFSPGSVTDVAFERGPRAGSNVTVEAAEPPAPPPPPEPEATPTMGLAPNAPIAVRGEPQALPLDLRRLTNNQRFDVPFVLDAETTLQITAVGEISGANRYDYAWIARAEDGTVVWEMTSENTVYAGGAPRNQRFDGTVTLPAGTYVLFVRSDDSHAFGNFVSDPPEDPNAWGIVVEGE
ncbi:MAG: hypothetical protein AAFU38_05055 [Bacteroidota bacterium]